MSESESGEPFWPFEEDEVPWRTFLKKYLHEYRPYGVKKLADEVPERVSREYLARLKICTLFFMVRADTDKSRVVRRANWECAVRTFGPVGEDGEQILETGYKMFQMRGFCGFHDQVAAAKILAADRKVGLYVIRTGSAPGTFAFTYIGKDKQMHNTRVEYDPTADKPFSIGEKRLAGWPEACAFMEQTVHAKYPSSRTGSLWADVKHFCDTGKTRRETEAEKYPQLEEYMPAEADSERMEEIVKEKLAKTDFSGMRVTAHRDNKYVVGGSTVDVTVLFEVAIGSTLSEGTAHVGAPLDLVVLLDRSNSMAGRRLDCAKLAVMHVINNLREGDRLTLVAFDKHAEAVFLSETVDGRSQMLWKVNDLGCKSGTNVEAALKLAYEILEEHPNPEGRRIQRVFLMSDGTPTSGEKDNEALARLSGQAFADRGVQTVCFGIGQGFDETLLQAIADRSSGDYIFVKSESKTVPAIKAALERTNTLVGHSGTLKVSPSDGVEFVRFVGPLERISKRKYVIGDVHLHSIVRVMAVFRLTPPVVDKQTKKRLAKLKFTFSPLSDEVEVPEIESRATVHVLPASEVPDAPPDPLVSAVKALLDANDKARAVLDAVDEGNLASAADLKRQEMELMQLAAKAAPGSDIELAFLLKRPLYAKFHDLIQTEGSLKELRKDVHYGNYAASRASAYAVL